MVNLLLLSRFSSRGSVPSTVRPTCLVAEQSSVCRCAGITLRGGV